MPLPVLSFLALACFPATEPAPTPEPDTGADTAVPDPPRPSPSGGNVRFYFSIPEGAEPRYCLYDDETCLYPDCDGNTPPVLGEPEYLVNGQPGTTWSAGDRLRMRFPYADAECNLRCGGEFHSFHAGTSMGASFISLCSNAGCATEEDGWYIVLDFERLVAGDYSFNLHVTDACGAMSNRMSGEFSL